MTSEACRELRASARRGRARRCRSRRGARVARPSRRLRRLPGRAARADVGRGGAAARRSVARRRRPAATAGRVGEACSRPRRGRAHARAERGRAAGSRSPPPRRPRSRRRSSRSCSSCPGNAPAGTQVVFASHAGVSADAPRCARARPAPRSRSTSSGLHEGEYYWLWLTGDDGDRIAAGHVPRHRRRRRTSSMTAALPLADARRIWVTDEHNQVVLDDTALPARASASAVAASSVRPMPQNVPEFEFSDNAKQVRAFVFEFWCEHGRGPDAARGAPGDRARPAPHHRRVQGAPARHRRRRQRGHAELQPAEGAAVLVVPVAGARVHRRRVPLVRRLRERGDRVLAHAAVQGQDRPARVALRVLLHAGHARSRRTSRCSR